MTSVPIQGEAKAPSKFWVLLTASLVSSLIMLDSNIVAVSLPAIGRSLVSCPRNTRYFVAIKMGPRQGGPSPDWR
jgi:hypothetical protein